MRKETVYLLYIAVVNTDPHPSLGVVQEDGVVCAIVVQNGDKVEWRPLIYLLWSLVKQLDTKTTH